MSFRPETSLRRRTATMAGLLALATVAAGCSSTSEGASGSPRADGGGSAVASPTPSPTPAARVKINLPEDGTTVHVDKVVTLDAKQGTFKKVSVTYGKDHEQLPGRFSDGKTSWTSTGRLEPGLRYQVKAVAVDGHGLATTERSAFRTDPLTLDQQTYPSIAPLQGETVGVGMPVIVKFDVAVTDKASIEKHLHVTNSSNQKGAWHWISDHEVHWRPVHYWKPGTDVTVKADIDSIPAGNGIYGQLSRSTSFHVGDAMIDKVNLATHEMKVYRNGQLLRTIPITGGKDGFSTRSGIKVIIEKFRHKRMDAATTGISKDSPEYYNIADVEYAMRVTYSGEFLHAAPWSVGSQGGANVSHGCVGMSTSDAAWLFNLTKRGDVVDVTGSDRPMTLTNGYGDWNESFAEYKQGSALD
ncbi:MAG: Ig-like domain-containing protein [Nocardioidaceae bacterium]